jgi:uncharacterized protein (UPF0335 family)
MTDTQIKPMFERWERLEGEKKAISDDLKELFSEAKHAGYDSKALRAAFNRKVKQDAATPEDAHFDAVVDIYLDALNGSARDARMPARENIEEFDAETGEITIIDRDDEDGNHIKVTVDSRVAAILNRSAEQPLQSPRQAAEAVSERTAFQDERNVEATVEQRSSVLVEADTPGSRWTAAALDRRCLIARSKPEST